MWQLHYAYNKLKCLLGKHFWATVVDDDSDPEYTVCLVCFAQKAL